MIKECDFLCYQGTEKNKHRLAPPDDMTVITACLCGSRAQNFMDGIVMIETHDARTDEVHEVFLPLDELLEIARRAKETWDNHTGPKGT